MKLLLSIVLLLLTSVAVANTSTTQVEAQNLPWSFEASAMAQTIENANSPSVGATAIYNATERFEFGLRALTTLVGNEFERGHSIQLVERYRFYKGKSDLFLEFNQGYAVDYFEEYSLFGGALGLSHKLNEEISIGGIAGADKIVDESGISPKISTFVSISL